MWLTVFTSQVQQVTSTSTKNQYVTRLVAVVVCILAMMMMMVCDVLTTPQGRTPPPPPRDSRHGPQPQRTQPRRWGFAAPLP